MGERIVFRPWCFRLAVESVKRPTPRAADPPVGGGEAGAEFANCGYNQIVSDCKDGVRLTLFVGRQTPRKGYYEQQN